MKYIDRTNGQRLEKIDRHSGQNVYKVIGAKYQTIIRCNDNHDFIMPAGELEKPFICGKK